MNVIRIPVLVLTFSLLTGCATTAVGGIVSTVKAELGLDNPVMQQEYRPKTFLQKQQEIMKSEVLQPEAVNKKPSMFPWIALFLAIISGGLYILNKFRTSQKKEVKEENHDSI
jgi:hypothetical protein